MAEINLDEKELNEKFQAIVDYSTLKGVLAQLTEAEAKKILVAWQGEDKTIDYQGTAKAALAEAFGYQWFFEKKLPEHLHVVYDMHRHVLQTETGIHLSDTPNTIEYRAKEIEHEVQRSKDIAPEVLEWNSHSSAWKHRFFSATPASNPSKASVDQASAEVEASQNQRNKQ